MRSNDAAADKGFALVRLIRSVVGLAIIALGAFVFIKAPEHAAGYAIILTTVGGVLFDPNLIKPSNIRRILLK